MATENQHSCLEPPVLAPPLGTLRALIDQRESSLHSAPKVLSLEAPYLALALSSQSHTQILLSHPGFP